MPANSATNGVAGASSSSRGDAVLDDPPRSITATRSARATRPPRRSASPPAPAAPASRSTAASSAATAPRVAGSSAESGSSSSSSLRPASQRPRQRHPLALAARELPRAARPPGGRCPSRPAARRRSVPGAERDVCTHGHVREEGVVLEHEPDAAAARAAPRRRRRPALTVALDDAARRPLEAGDQPQQRGLAGARRADDRERARRPPPATSSVKSRSGRVSWARSAAASRVRAAWP